MRRSLSAPIAGIAGLSLLLTTNCIETSTGPANDPQVILDYSGCSDDRLPLWLAVRDGPTGEWTRLTAVNGVYSFEFTSVVGGIAVVAYVGGNIWTMVEFRTVDEISARAQRQCATATKSVGGSVTGLGAGDVATIWVSGGATTSLAANGSFGPIAIPDGPVDLVATQSNAATGDGAHRVILRRDLEIATGGSFAPLDFASVEAVAPARATLTVVGAGAGNLTASTGYVPRSATSCLWSPIPSATSPNVLLGVPSASPRSDEVHFSFVISSEANFSRTTVEWFHSFGDRTVTLRDPVPAPTVTTVAGPYRRLRASVTLAPEDDLMGFSYDVRNGGTHAQLLATAGYVARAGATQTFPDLSTVSGWQNSWMPAEGSSGMWSLFVSDQSDSCLAGSRTRRISFTGAY